MNESLRKIPYWGALALLAYMPFHIFLSQSLSLWTGGLNSWKIGKDVLTLVLLLISIGLVFYFKKATSFYKNILLLSALYFLLHLVIFKLNGAVPWQVAALATVYNNRLLWFVLIGLSAAALTPKLDYQKIIKWVLIISSIVCLLGVAQFVLPKDLMTHFGYSVERGARSAFFIDDKPDLPRIFSTLRDPNSLGAFLILPITLLIAQLFGRKPRPSSSFYLLSSALALHLAALALTFSRSAWLGTLLSAGFLLGYLYKEPSIKFLKKYWLLLAFGFLLLAGGVYASRDQYFVQNVVFHSDESTRDAGSTEKHASYALSGIKAVAAKPLGHGPGTAGLVSIHTPTQTVLTENYFIQIAYEVGWLGLAVFVYLNYLVYQKLRHSPPSTFHLPLLASFWGLLLCNLLLHTWSNEAVALQWWLLAGLTAKQS